MDTLTNAVSPEPLDSGPGPLDVLEARITLDQRRALDSAARYLEQIAETASEPRGRSPLEIAAQLHRALSRYEYESVTAQALAGLTTDPSAL